MLDQDFDEPAKEYDKKTHWASNSGVQSSLTVDEIVPVLIHFVSRRARKWTRVHVVHGKSVQLVFNCFICWAYREKRKKNQQSEQREMHQMVENLQVSHNVHLLTAKPGPDLLSLWTWAVKVTIFQV